jgi:hypothetical protein
VKPHVHRSTRVGGRCESMVFPDHF